jgi:plastocyanin
LGLNWRGFVLLKRALLVFTALVLLSSAFALAACGGNDDGDDEGGGQVETSAPVATIAPTAAPTATTTAQATSAAGGPQQITIADFSYAPITLTAQAGQPVNLTVRNQGALPHTFTITGVVDSGTLQAGAQAAVNFTPSQAGTLTYFCTIHGQATMSGTLTVS